MGRLYRQKGQSVNFFTPWLLYHISCHTALSCGIRIRRDLSLQQKIGQMDDLIQMFRIAVCPSTEDAHDRLAVITQDELRLKTAAVLIHIPGLHHHFKKMVDMLLQKPLDLIFIICLYAFFSYRARHLPQQDKNTGVLFRYPAAPCISCSICSVLCSKIHRIISGISAK